MRFDKKASRFAARWFCGLAYITIKTDETRIMYITQTLRRAVQQRPDQIAVSFGDRKRTFKEFGDRVARLANALKKLGVQSGDRVAMLSLNSDRYLEYQMAVPWAGGGLNPCNTRWSAAEIQYSLKDSETRILLMDEALRLLAETIRGQSSCVQEWIYCGEGETPSGMHDYETLIDQNEPVHDALRGGNDLAGIFYTGGTTGFPKGVMLSHANILASGLSVASEGIGPRGATYLHAAPMFHLADIGMAMAHWLATPIRLFPPLVRKQ
jgi:acyl-CoA synthetase (AMP-forming)/AMP-acid ligase II